MQSCGSGVRQTILKGIKCRVYITVVINQCFVGVIGIIYLCIWSENCVHFLRRGNIEDTTESAQSYLDLGHHKISWFGALSFVWQVHTITLTCLNDLWCSLGLWKAILERSTIILMATIITRVPACWWYLSTFIYIC
jgi:hypothetical protein